MSYVSEFVALYEICPYIRNFPLDDESIRVAVRDYFSGDKEKDAIIKKYGKMEYWNTSEVTDMSCLFEYCSDFNEDISKWAVSKVTDMYCMFYYARSFNQPIEKWNTSNVTNMLGMFMDCESFNQDISKWDTSKVTNMECMFNGAKSFNQTISKWDTSKVKYAEEMFIGAITFNPKNASCSLLKMILCIDYENDSYSDSDDE